MTKALHVLAVLGIATGASAACDPHPYERFTIYDTARPENPTRLVGDACELRAGDGNTAALSCAGRVYQLVRDQP